MKQEYQRQLNETLSLVDSLPWSDRQFYTTFIGQTYHFVCHSTRMLARSISYFGVDRDNLYRRFIDHLKEENYHERLIENDLKHLGLSPTDFPEFGITRAFWECQFHKIDQSNGISVLGYILYLESIAAHCFASANDTLAGAFGKEGTKFIDVHINEDPSHVAHAQDLIGQLPEEEQSIIWKNFYQTAELYHLLAAQVKASLPERSAPD